MTLEGLTICESCGEKIEGRFHYGCSELLGAVGEVIGIEDLIASGTSDVSDIEQEWKKDREQLVAAFRIQARKIKNLRQAVKWLKKSNDSFRGFDTDKYTNNVSKAFLDEL